eukprot:CAMPEP_0172324540 /NCGR_PEP_ID=MMETSP1058-20130122/51624_1 /TAXON_ID=83371 /ORGANISM="Detonula confervacea, Strain CCMP 353" /LENGTH=71 /DNA_ID=CAMNT_0013040841 /DNA_START=226 /DNA_END=441 /DNA_ORIENTATION=-
MTAMETIIMQTSISTDEGGDKMLIFTCISTLATDSTLDALLISVIYCLAKNGMGALHVAVDVAILIDAVAR